MMVVLDEPHQRLTELGIFSPRSRVKIKDFGDQRLCKLSSNQPMKLGYSNLTYPNEWMVHSMKNPKIDDVGVPGRTHGLDISEAC